jgi:kumamolisin
MTTERYGFPLGLSGKGECIGILAFGGGASSSDFSRFFERHARNAPDLRFEGVARVGRPNLNSRFDAELALDIQLAGALAPGARIVAYCTSNDDRGWVEGVRRAIFDRENTPSVLSISWGATEDSWDSGTIDQLNQLFREAAAMGITVCAASGDDGCARGADGFCRVSFPASSPYVLACGGTSWQSGGNERVWNVRNTNASGGGVSDRIARPQWQRSPSDVILPPIPSRRDPDFDGRQLPDVSGLASHSYSIYVGGAYQNRVGGTSAVAPLWSALIARLNEGLRDRGLPRIGHFHPLLYRDQRIQGSFQSVLSGHNDPYGASGYHAGPGWNPCTGWGTPNGELLFEALCQTRATPG